MRARNSVYQLRGDAQAIAALPDGTFEHVAHAEFAPDLFDVNRPALVDEGTVSGDHEQPANARQPGDDVFDHAVGEVLLLWIAGHVLEREHGDGRLVGQGQRHRRRGCRIRAAD